MDEISIIGLDVESVDTNHDNLHDFGTSANIISTNHNNSRLASRATRISKMSNRSKSSN